MNESILLNERRGPVATLTLNRPRSKNALNPELIAELGHALRLIVSSDVRVVVLTGAGGAFCSGADLKEGLSGADASNSGLTIDALHELIRLIATAPQPFIAAIDGAAVGFGCDLALACDLRVMSSRAYLQEIFVKIGLMPDGGGTFWVPRLVGMGRAMEYLLLGTRLDAPLAREVGLANRVVEPPLLHSEVVELSDQLAAGPPLAQERIKRALRASLAGGLDEALHREKTNQLELLRSKDVLEGVTAWAERRPPSFKGE